MIKETLKLIEEQIGLNLNLCTHFSGLKESNRGKYFNVILNNKNSESSEYIKLEKLAKKYNQFRVEPNGVSRVAIFPLKYEKL